MNHLNTIDYLFLQFRSIHIKLEDIRAVYYSHLCPEKMKEKARQQQLPFTCFRIDESSQKGHFFVEIHEFSKAIDEIYLKNRQSFTSAVQKSTKPKE